MVVVLAKDPIMAGLIARYGRLRIGATQREPYEALCEAVVYQQLHANAASAIFKRFKQAIGRGGDALPSPRRLLAASDEALRATGLSRNKIAALRDIAQHALDGRLPDLAACRKLDNETLISRLSDIHGIGRWTVEMFLIFALGRRDVLPADDYGVRRGFMMAHALPEMPTPRALAEAGRRWAPYRTLAALYLWRMADGGKDWKGPQ